VSAARAFFGFDPKGTVHLEDGRTFLERGEDRYGAVFLDAFGSETPPYHLFTAEAFEAVKRRLEPGRGPPVNLLTMGPPEPGNAPWRAAYKTLRSVFKEVRAFSASDTYQDVGNVVLFASDGPLAPRAAVRAGVKTNVDFMLGNELTLTEPELSRSLLLTD